MAVTTTRKDSNTWTADTEYGIFTLELPGNNFSYENFSDLLSVGSTVLNMENVGYNTWLGKSESGNLFTVTMLTEKMAVITADIGDASNDLYDIDIVAIMQRVDTE